MLRPSFAALASLVTLVLGGCAAPSSDDASAEAVEREVRSNDPVAAGQAQAPALPNAMAAPGLREDLLLATSAENVDGVLSASPGYGVDLVAITGPFGAGYGGADQDGAPSAKVNGRTVGQMSITIDGARAAKLFGAMTVSPSRAGSLVTKRSPGGRVSCVQSPDAQVFCTLGGFVSFTVGH